MWAIMVGMTGEPGRRRITLGDLVISAVIFYWYMRLQGAAQETEDGEETVCG